MILIPISFLIIHSLSQWQSPSKSIKLDKKDFSYAFDQVGFNEIDNIQGGDSIKIRFNQNSLRLFAIFTKKPHILLNNLYIDGIDILKNADDLSDKIAYAIDANQEVIFKFKTLKENNNRPKIQKNIKSLISKLNFFTKHDHYDDFYGEDPAEYLPNSVNAKLWILPRHFCGKSSVFEYGGTASNLTIGLTNNMVTSRNQNEIKYTNCIFSPLFDKNNTYSLKIDVKPYAENNGFLSSQKMVFTDNTEIPEFTSPHDDTENHSISKPFFVKYEITQKLSEGQFISPSNVDTEMVRKVIGRFKFNFDVVGFVCQSGVFEDCDSSGCFKDDFAEESLFVKCENEMLTSLIRLMIALGMVVFIIIILLIFCCGCFGCCCCCCAVCCIGKGGCCEKRNADNDGATQSRWRRGRQQNDIEVPLMSIDQNQGLQTNPYNTQMTIQGQNVIQQPPQVSPYDQEPVQYL